jgi:hypothetical protein
MCFIKSALHAVLSNPGMSLSAGQFGLNEIEKIVLKAQV